MQHPSVPPVAGGGADERPVPAEPSRESLPALPRPRESSTGEAHTGLERDLAGALHEVSNALTVVLGWLESARYELSDSDPIKRAVDIAWSRALLGRGIARRAIGAETAEPEEDASLAELAQDAVLGVEREASKRGTTVELSTDASAAGALVGAAPALLQVLTNLLLNAIAMSPEGAKVKVEIGVASSEAVLAVADNGPGIAPERRATLFHSRISRRTGGAGIGLAHAHALSQNKGGWLRLATAERGARFEIGWPLVASRSSQRLSSRAPAPLHGVRVLLLEDDDAVIGLLSTALSLRGADVSCARTEGELLQATAAGAGSGTFDAVLLNLPDLRQPRGSGEVRAGAQPESEGRRHFRVGARYRHGRNGRRHGLGAQALRSRGDPRRAGRFACCGRATRGLTAPKRA